MKQSSLARWLKTIIIGVGICGAIAYAALIHIFRTVSWMSDAYFYTWLVFIAICAIPCYAALVIFWNVAALIGKDRAFCIENAVHMRNVSVLAAVDSVFLFVGNIVMLLIRLNHSYFLILSGFAIVVGMVVSIVCAVLSNLIRKASDLQDQSDLTI